MNKEDDAHQQLGQAPLAAERYCKPVTTDGRDGRRRRLKREPRGQKLRMTQIGSEAGRCGRARKRN